MLRGYSPLRGPSLDENTRGPAEGPFVSSRENSNWDLKAVAFFNRTMTEATDWKMVAPMLLAAPFYQVGKIGALKFFLNNPAKSILGRSLGLAVAPVVAGFALENTFFSLANRGLTHFTESPLNWSLESIAKDWLTSGLSLGFLKGVGSMGRRGMMGLRGLEESTAAAWTRADHRALWFAAQASGYLGLVGAHGLETKLGLRVPEAGGNIWVDALGTHIALGMGTHWGRRLAGPHLEALEQRLSAQAHVRLQEARDSTPSSGSFFPNFSLGRIPALAGYAGGFVTHRPTTDLEVRQVYQVGEDHLGEGPLLSSLPPPHETRNHALAGKYVVIGNNGEPAVRAINTVKEMGGQPIIYVSDADTESLHATLDGVITIPLKGRDANDTYQNINARISGLDRLMRQRDIKAKDVIAWEGWGFLSENPDIFARYEEMKIGIAGAPSKSHRLMGDKVSARRIAREAGVSIVEGSEEISSVEEGLQFANQVGFPVIIKGQNTGGGSGIREVFKEAEFQGLYEDASREAEKTSGRPSVFIEKFITSMRHLEVQVVADGQGNYVILGERDCTIQRKLPKKQKIIEEEVSNSLPPEIKAEAREIAAKIMSHPEMKDYKGPGTIEIIWDQKTNKIYFMEMNTRIQVEHPVTEMVTGKNILKAQLELGAGLPLSFDQKDVNPKGHSIEARITAEDPFNGFTPSAGRILHYREPHAHKTARIRVRVDSGVDVGSVKTTDYDPLLAKLIVWGETREHALEGLRNALDQFEILGLKTNIPFLKKLIASETFKKGEVPDTNWVQDVFLKSDQGRPDYQDYPEAIVTVAIQTFLQRKDELLKSRQGLIQGGNVDPKVKLSFQGNEFETEVYELGSGKFKVKVGDHSTEVGLKRSGDYLYNLQLGMQRRVFIKAGQGWREVLLNNQIYPVEVAGEVKSGPGVINSPLPGKVWKILAQPGQPIKKGDTLAIVEAMKLEHSITSTTDGIVEKIHVSEGDQVPERGALMDLKVVGSEAEQPKQEVQIENKFNFEEDAKFEPAFLQVIQSIKEEILPEERALLMEEFRSYFKGYDNSVPDLLKALPKLKLPNGSSPVDETRRAELEKFIGELINDYLETEGLFTPARWAHWVRYQQLGILPDPNYKERLEKVLTSRGIDSHEPSFERREVIYRLTQSHNRRKAKADILKEFVPWVSEYQMAELLSSLAPLARLYLDGVPKSFSNLVSDHQFKLERKISGARETPSLEREFEVIVQGGPQRAQAIKVIFDHSDEVLPFLVRQTLQREESSARLYAFQLLQKYFYGSRYEAAEISPMSNGHVARLVPHPDVMAKGLQVDFSGIEGERVTPENFSQLLMEVAPRGNRNETEHIPNRALNIVLPSAPENNDYTPYLNILNQVLADRSVEQVICIVQENPERVGFHTFERSGDSGRWEEAVSLRGSHPVAAEDRGLDRWEENFKVTPSEEILASASNVLAYKLQAKNDSRDNRQLVIGEHRGRVTLERFEGERAENRLINDYHHLISNPLHPLDQDSRVVWSWLPYALKEKGLASHGLDPFSFGVLTSTPAELIKMFGLNEKVLQEVASFYHDKVKSVPEVERVARDTALAVDQIQDQGSPTVADIYIWQPVNLSDAEINLLAFRLAPNFIGKNLEKTTVHFKRNLEGKTKKFIAEIKVPGKTRFEVIIKEAKEDLPPHRVRTPLERKRLKQQSKGKLYVYDHVGLIRDVVKEEFFPLGNAPADGIHIREMVLGTNGELASTDREVGKNDLSKVAFEVTLPLPLDDSGEKTVSRSFMVIADDYTVRNGAMGRREGQLHKAVADYAIQKGIPQLYIDESVGAFIGFAKELLPFVHYDHQDNIILVHGSDLDKVIPGTDQKVRDIIEIGGDNGMDQFPVTSITGIGEINTESLNGSGMAGEAMSRARAHVPTATIVLNPSVGIATYLARLSEFVIMLKDSYLGLTGRKAINNTFGTNYKTETEIAGAEVMADTGVAYKVAHGEREALRSYLEWLSYQPVKMGEDAPRFYIDEQESRRRSINNVIVTIKEKRGQPYDSKLLDYAIYDPGSVYYVQSDGYWGRRINVGFARLFGVPLGISSDQLIPKAYPGENENMLYGGALDGHSSIKLAHHLRTVNRFGLNYLGISGFLGFLARLGDHLGTEESLGKNVHVEGRVIPGGAEILDELRQFEQAALLLVPHQGLLYGGAWAVIDRNVNPNIVKVADFTSQLGILGSVASNELPLATDHQKTPEDKKKTRIMFDLQNTPQRALKVGSIHHVIEDVGRTPAILYGLLEQKTAEIRQAREAKKKEEILIRQVTGGLDLMGVGYALLPGGKIRIDFPEGTITTGLESAKKGITAHFQSRPANPMGMLLAKPEEEK